jgi:hypothetical protein
MEGPGPRSSQDRSWFGPVRRSYAVLRTGPLSTSDDSDFDSDLLEFDSASDADDELSGYGSSEDSDDNSREPINSDKWARLIK